MPKSSKIKNLDTTANRPSQVDGIIEDLKMKSRLSAKDKRRFAMNLGKLAARVDSDKPLRGAQQIIKRSKQEGIEESESAIFDIQMRMTRIQIEEENMLPTPHHS